MAEENKTKAEKPIGSQAAEESYKTAKLLRRGNRELERQMNIKKLKSR